MKLPIWTKPALSGAAVGAVALAIVGFSWGGWVTAGSAATLATKAKTAGMVEALTPYCVDNAGAITATVAMGEFKGATTYARKGIVEKAGWATPLGAEKPFSELAQACQLKLAEAL